MSSTTIPEDSPCKGQRNQSIIHSQATPIKQKPSSGSGSTTPSPERLPLARLDPRALNMKPSQYWRCCQVRRKICSSHCFCNWFCANCKLRSKCDYQYNLIAYTECAFIYGNGRSCWHTRCRYCRWVVRRQPRLRPRLRTAVHPWISIYANDATSRFRNNLQARGGNLAL